MEKESPQVILTTYWTRDKHYEDTTRLNEYANRCLRVFQTRVLSPDNNDITNSREKLLILGEIYEEMAHAYAQFAGSKRQHRKMLMSLKDLHEIFDECISNSHEDSDDVIEKKIERIRQLCSITPNILEHENAYGRTAIRRSKAHIKILLELLKLGASPLVDDPAGENLLHVGSEIMHLTLEEYHQLLESVPMEHVRDLVHRVDYIEDTPLGSLLKSWDPIPKTLELFQRAGADFNHKNKKQRPILILASWENRNADTIVKLMECGSDVFSTDESGRTVLHYGHATPEDYDKIVKAISPEKLKELVGIEDLNGYVPLAILVGHRNPLPETLDIFKKAGADFNHVTEYGRSILAIATRDGSVASLRKLIELGADVNLKYDSHFADLLHYAAMWGNEQAVRFYCEECGFDVNGKNEKGSTALQYAKQSKRFEACKVLKELGALE